MPANEENRFVLTRANIISMDEDDSRHTALAVENGRILAAGTEADVAPFIRQGWPVHDLDGKTVLPGFIDTHQHLGLTGQVLAGIRLGDAPDLDAVYELVAEGARSADEDAWVLGYSLNELNLTEKTLPDRAALDAACPDKPVMLVHASWHLCVLNSAALDRLDLPPDLPGMDLDAAGPTGVVRDPGALSHMFPAVSVLTPRHVKLARFRQACRAALRQGITTLHCLEGGEFGPGDTRIIVENRDQLPLNTVVWNQVLDIEETLELGLKRIGGCICADGAMSAHTAALLEPYSDQPDNCGTLNFSQQQMDDFILAAHREGLQVAIHCETDGAIEQVLTAMEKALAVLPRDDHRHRIEHCEIPTMDQIDRMAKAGIIGAMQPAFFTYLVDWDDYESWFGPDRMRMLHPYRTMLNAGMKLCGGSDGPITPYGPLTGIQAAVLHPVEEERLSVIEALRLFTSDAAYSGFEDTERGTIEPGRSADLVILSEDPNRVAPDTIAAIEILDVLVAGRSAI